MSTVGKLLSDFADYDRQNQEYPITWIVSEDVWNEVYADFAGPEDKGISNIKVNGVLLIPIG